MPKRRADDQNGHEPDRGLYYRCYGPLCRIKKSILQQKVLYGVSGKAKLGKYCDSNRFFVARFCGIQYRGRIRGRIGHTGNNRAGRNACEAMTVD